MLRTQMDRLKDAEMTLEYADVMKELGEAALANMFLSQAKTRIAAAMDCDHCTTTVFENCYASNSKTSTYACADTPEGGFNNTTNPPER